MQSELQFVNVSCSEEEHDSFEKNLSTFLYYQPLDGPFDFSNQMQLDTEYRQMIPPDIYCSEEEEKCLEKDIQTFCLYQQIDGPFDFSNQALFDAEYRQMRLVYSMLLQIVGD
jgi:hypothetical protein